MTFDEDRREDDDDNVDVVVNVDFLRMTDRLKIATTATNQLLNLKGLFLVVLFFVPLSVLLIRAVVKI